MRGVSAVEIRRLLRETRGSCKKKRGGHFGRGGGCFHTKESLGHPRRWPPEAVLLLRCDEGLVLVVHPEYGLSSFRRRMMGLESHSLGYIRRRSWRGGFQLHWIRKL